MKVIYFLILSIIAFTANSEDSLLLNFETENVFVSSSNLSLYVKTEKQKFLNIYINTTYDNIPVAVNDIPILGEGEFSIILQEKNEHPYLFITQKKPKLINQEQEQLKQWLFQLPFPDYCKKINPILIENGATGNSAIILLNPLEDNSIFSNISQIPSVTFQLSDKQEEKDLLEQEKFTDDQIIYGISDKIVTPLTDSDFVSIFKNEKFSFEANLQWDPSQNVPLITYTINNTCGLFHKVDKDNSILIWPSPSISIFNKQTKQTGVSINGINFIKEKTIFTIPFITINMQKLSGASLYFIYPIPKQFCSYSPKLNLSMQIVRFKR